jgi:hypothetical protein
MAYTIQLHADTGNWATPTGVDVRHALNKHEATELVRDWAEVVGRYDDAQCAYAFAWKGEHDDVTDLYPDFQVVLGTRLGVHWVPA